MLVGQLIFDGLAMGLIFVILASGMTIIMSVSRILFIAYGVFYTIGAYATWYAIDATHLPYFPCLIIGLLAAGILGTLSYILFFQRLSRMEGGFIPTLVASLGLSMVLTQGGVLVYGSEPRSIPTVFPGSLNWLGINMTVDKIALIGIGVAVTFLLFWIYEKTKVGRSMRAVSFLPEAATLQGINTNRIYMIALGTGCMIAGFAGGILAPSYGMNPEMGSNVLWTVMLMVMLGGTGSLLGAVVGGVVIGQMLSFGQFYIGGMIQIIIFVVIGIVLYFKPAGLLGRKIDIGF